MDRDGFEKRVDLLEKKVYTLNVLVVIGCLVIIFSVFRFVISVLL